MTAREVRGAGDAAPLGFSFTTRLAAPAARVWEHATSIPGVNRELFPLARMTCPREYRELRPAPGDLGRPLFRSWILALGFLPVDYDDLTLVAFEPGRFLEHSQLLSQREWIHERTVVADGTGCVVSDHVRFVPRVRFLGPLHRFVFRQVFRLRHRNLGRLFGVRR